MDWGIDSFGRYPSDRRALCRHAPHRRASHRRGPPRARGALPLEAVGRWTHTFSRCPVSVAACSEAKMSPRAEKRSCECVVRQITPPRSTYNAYKMKAKQHALRSNNALLGASSLFGATTRSSEHQRTLRSNNALHGASSLFGATTRSTEQKRALRSKTTCNHSAGDKETRRIRFSSSSSSSCSSPEHATDASATRVHPYSRSCR